MKEAKRFENMKTGKRFYYLVKTTSSNQSCSILILNFKSKSELCLIVIHFN